MRRETLGFLLGFVGVAIFGATLPVTRLAIASFDPWFITFARASAAALLAAMILIILRRPFPRRHGFLLGLAALTLVVGFPGFSSLAMKSVPAAHGGVVLGVLPLATAVAAMLVNGERPSARFWLLAVIGAGLVAAFALRDSPGGPHGGFAAGDIWLAAAAASAALGYAISGRLARQMPGWEVISWALLIALPVAAPFTVMLWRPDYLAAPGSHWAALGYLAFFSMYLGFFAWNAGLALGGVARVSQVQLLQTFITLAISAAILGEVISGEMLGFALAVSGIVFLGRKAPVGRS
jgi:drug/metabolite transporter (DMT)-like permease